jgi:ElaB/YqjD/DUF883 family membrane-anchored ribosome-binding protein
MNTQDIADKADEMKNQVRGWTDAACEQTRRAGEAADRYVHENTWTSVGIALGLGALIGFAVAKLNESD